MPYSISKHPRLHRALIRGAIGEAIAIGAVAAFGGMGPCGPTNSVTVLALLWHLPSAIVALILSPLLFLGKGVLGWCVLALSMVANVLAWSTLFYAIDGRLGSLLAKIAADLRGTRAPPPTYGQLGRRSR